MKRTIWQAGLRVCGVGLGAILGVCAVSMASASEPSLGFGGPEVFPLDPQMSHLRAADLDGDGLVDLVLANNNRSKLQLLFNRSGKTNSEVSKAAAVRRELNELPPDARFRVDSIASEKRITSLVVGDLNGDGRVDIAYYGEPKELVVHCAEPGGRWGLPKKWAINDGLSSPAALVEGDLNNDGRMDLLLLSEQPHAYLLIQQTQGGLPAEPERLPITAGVKGAQIVDVDGDKRNDLLLVNWESAHSVRVRFQGGQGGFGPELLFPWSPIRAFWAEDVDGDGKAEALTIANQSGRAQLGVFRRVEGSGESQARRGGQFLAMPLSRTTREKRGAVWVDVNQDGRVDLVVAEPESGQLTLMLRNADGGFEPARAFPSFTGITDLVAADWDGDGRDELFVLSKDERVVGVTQLDASGRFPFPRVLGVEGRPLAIAVGRWRDGEKPVLAVVTEQDSKRDLRVLGPGGELERQRLSESFKSTPASVAFHDLDQDGLSDLVVLVEFEKMKLLVRKSSGGFEEVDLAPPGGAAEKAWMSAADVDGDQRAELLLAQKNFVRAVTLRRGAGGGAGGETNWVLSVKDQVNGVSSSSKVVAAVADPKGAGAARLYLLDAERKAVTVCERDASLVWQPVGNIPLPVVDFQSMQMIPSGAGQRPLIGFLGLGMAAWLSLDGPVWELMERDGYETPVKDGFLNDVVVGDVNGDRRKDLVFLETGKNHLDVVTLGDSGNLVPVNRWQVFEERTFRNRRADAPEPREALVEDVTGDGKPDIVILVHDRVLVYPQE